MPPEGTAAMNLLEIRDEFVAWLEAKGNLPYTARVRGRSLREFIAFLKNRSVQGLEEVTRSRVEEYRTWVMAREHIYTGRKLSPGVVGYHLSTVKIFFGFLLKRKVLMIDPTAALTWPKSKARLPKNIPTEREMEAILARPVLGTLMGLRDRAILELIYSTGIRRAEAAMLDVYDVNLAERTLTVRCGKGGKGRTLPVGKTALEFLTRWLNEARPKMMNHMGRESAGGRSVAELRTPGAAEPLIRSVGRSSTALFVIPGGARFRKDALGVMVGRYVRAVKPEATMTCHAIRHAFATHMLKGGADLAVIQRLLGHTHIETTEIYTQVKPEDLKKEHKRCHPRGRERR